MTTLAKGSRYSTPLTGSAGDDLSEAAEATGLSRATARRMLHTLAELGYVEQTGRRSRCRRDPEFRFAYLATQNWIDKAPPLMRQLSEQLRIPARRRSFRIPRSSMSPASPPAASCRYRWRSGRGCRRSTPHWAARSLAFSMTPNSGGGFARSASIPIRLRPSSMFRRCTTGSAKTARRVSDHRRRTGARTARDRGADRGP